jgi:hypothetical protein
MKRRTPDITEIVAEPAPVRAAIAKARKRLRKEAPAGDTAQPTPERAAKAGAELRRDAVRAYHCEDAPIERLAARKALASDEGGNRTLLEAGKRYYEHWYLAGLNGLGAIDLTRAGGGDGSPACGMPTTEAAAHHRREFRAALDALGKAGKRLSEVVDLVVLHEQEIEAIARKVSGYKDKTAATAVTLDRLRTGLECLARHFRIGRLDTVRMGMQSPCHDSEKRPERSSRALSRHRSLAGM